MSTAVKLTGEALGARLGKCVRIRAKYDPKNDPTSARVMRPGNEETGSPASWFTKSQGIPEGQLLCRGRVEGLLLQKERGGLCIIVKTAWYQSDHAGLPQKTSDGTSICRPVGFSAECFLIPVQSVMEITREPDPFPGLSGTCLVSQEEL